VSSFEWDAAKDRVNRRKHGVSFDRARILAEDPGNSGTEQRFFCFGWADGGVMTV
jgi:hypothetical protein